MFAPLGFAVKTAPEILSTSACKLSAATPFNTISNDCISPLCVNKSSNFPVAASFPFRKIATLSHKASMSDKICVDIKTVVPLERSSAISSRTSRRPIGSSPLIGSSKKTISGSLINDWAMPTRCNIPLENFRSCLFQSFSSSPTLVKSSSVFCFPFTASSPKRSAKYIINSNALR